MGVDLTIGFSIVEDVVSDRSPLIYERLKFERQRDLWPEIRKVESIVVPKVEWYSDNGIKIITTDAYGIELKACRVSDLAKVIRESDVRLYAKNQAIVQYLKALDPKIYVLLYWH